MPHFEFQISMDYFWKNNSTTTFHEWTNSKLAINDHLEHFMNMNFEFEVSLYSIFGILVTKPRKFSL